MKFYIVRPKLPALQQEHEPIYVELSLDKAHATGRDLFGHPPYSVDVVDLQVSAQTIMHLLERVDPKRLRGSVFAGEAIKRTYPINNGMLASGIPEDRGH